MTLKLKLESDTSTRPRMWAGQLLVEPHALGNGLGIPCIWRRRLSASLSTELVPNRSLIYVHRSTATTCKPLVYSGQFPDMSILLSRLVSRIGLPPASEHRAYQNVSNFGMRQHPGTKTTAAPFKRGDIGWLLPRKLPEGESERSDGAWCDKIHLGSPFLSNPNPTRGVRKTRPHIKPTETICRITRAGIR